MARITLRRPVDIEKVKRIAIERASIRYASTYQTSPVKHQVGTLGEGIGAAIFDVDMPDNNPKGDPGWDFIANGTKIDMKASNRKPWYMSVHSITADIYVLLWVRVPAPRTWIPDEAAPEKANLVDPKYWRWDYQWDDVGWATAEDVRRLGRPQTFQGKRVLHILAKDLRPMETLPR